MERAAIGEAPEPSANTPGSMLLQQQLTPVGFTVCYWSTVLGYVQ